MILYDAAWAPSPRRVRVFLAEKQVEVAREQIDMRSNAQLSEAYLAINPRGTVPALKLDSGEVIDESAAICRYFEALHPNPPLFGKTPLEIAQIEAWTRRIASDCYAAGAYLLRNTRPHFAERGLAGKWPAVPQIAALADRAQLMWESFMTALDAHLATRELIATDHYSFADITALIAIDFGIVAGLPRPESHANVMRWNQAALARPSASA